MSLRPDFIAPTQHTSAASALAQVQHIYQTSIAHLRTHMQAFVAGASYTQRVRACYPFVRIHTHQSSLRSDSAAKHLSYGFVAQAGRFETTLTRPDLFAHYLQTQFDLLLQNHGEALEVGVSSQPIPVHFSFAENDHIEGEMSVERRARMREVFDLPDLTTMDDGIANGTYQAQLRLISAVGNAVIHRRQIGQIKHLAHACASLDAHLAFDVVVLGKRKMHRDRLTAHAHFQRLAVVLQQQIKLRLQIMRKQIGARQRGLKTSSLCDKAVAQMLGRAVAAQAALVRVDAHKRITSPHALRVRRTGHKGLHVRAQMRDAGLVNVLHLRERAGGTRVLRGGDEIGA